MGFKILGQLITWSICGILLVLTLHCLCYFINYAWYKRRRIFHGRPTVIYKNDPKNMEMARRLAKATRYETHRRNPLMKDQLKKLHAFIKESFPKVHSSEFIEWKVLAGFSLLYHVKGTDASLKPYMLCGHMDVVPAPPCCRRSHPESEELVLNDRVSGRGVLSGKHRLLGILEALEALLSLEEGFQFRRSIYLAFSHDKENGGRRGTRAIAAYLEGRRIEMKYILDEGTGITSCDQPWIDYPVALIGVAEKGELLLKLTVFRELMPQNPESAPEMLLVKVIKKLQSTVLTEVCGRVERALFKTLSQATRYRWFKPDYYYRWKFGRTIVQVYPNTSFKKTYQTTCDLINIVSNGLDEISAIVSVKHVFKESYIEAYHKVKKLINNDRVQTRILSIKEADVSSTNFGGILEIQNAIHSTFALKAAPVTNPTITDSKWYLNLSENVYRFDPLYFHKSLVPDTGCCNEEISVLDYGKVVEFFTSLMRMSN